MPGSMVYIPRVDGLYERITAIDSLMLVLCLLKRLERIHPPESFALIIKKKKKILNSKLANLARG